ncbi:MAG TPA: LysR substrate-binding domain-containing protein [Vicinamibacteria bacterium]
MNLEVRHLKLVTAIAEEGGVTRAASRLHLTQSALSHQLAGLEGRLGTRLFLRLGRRMVLTPAGQALVAAAGPLLEDLGRAEETVARIGSARAGVLRLATECYTCYHWVPPLMREFARRWPAVELRIVAEATRAPLDALAAGRLDLAVVSSPARDRRFATTPLFADELVAVMAPTHPLAGRSWLRPSDFAEENLILYTSPEESTAFQKMLVPAGVTPRQVSEIQLTEAIVEMVKAGLGVSVLARWSVAPHLAAGTLRAARLGRRGLRRRWTAATLRAAPRPEWLDAFVSLLARAAQPSADRVARAAS